MYRIVILTDTEVRGSQLAGWAEKTGREYGMFWCSDLDFSLQAYRLRGKYFLFGSVCEEEFKEGLSLGFEGRGRGRKSRKALGKEMLSVNA